MKANAELSEGGAGSSCNVANQPRSFLRRLEGMVMRPLEKKKPI